MSDETTERAVADAIDAGYRSFDTAAAYFNERALGAALASSGIDRSGLFVTTKLWNTRHTPQEAVFDACRRSLDGLGFEFLDLYLVHWPNSAAGTHVDAWRGMLAARRAGLTQSIGVCNYLERHLRDLDRAGLPRPSVNQIERHPLHSRPALVVANGKRRIVTEAWAPLGRQLLNGNHVIAKIARRHGRTESQILLRWNVQGGVVVIPKSQSHDRIRENMMIFDFELSAEEMAAIDALDRGHMTDPSLVRFQ